MIFKRKKDDDGHRQGTRDRDDPGTGDLTLTIDPGSSTAGGTVTGASTNLTDCINTALGLWGIAEATPDREPLPQREGDLPLMAWKYAHITRTSKGYRFTGVGDGSATSYLAVDTARCAGRSFIWQAFSGRLITDTHPAPDESCRCGFYGLLDRPEPNNEQILLEVEFYGRVIVAEHGYRAEKQRVLAVHADTCEFCDERPSLFVIPNGYGEGESHVKPRCAEHVGPFDVRLDTEKLMASLGLRERNDA